MFNKFSVENKEHYRRIMSLLLRKWRQDDEYSVKTNTVICPPWKEALIIKNLFISTAGLTEIEAEALIMLHDKRKHSDFKFNKDIAKQAMEKIKQPWLLTFLLPYVDKWMGLGNTEEAKDKILNLYSLDTDYGYSQSKYD